MTTRSAATAWYLTRKFLRRYRGPATATALLLLALTAGVIGTLAGLVRATASEADAKTQARLAGEERDRAREALANEELARQEATEALDAVTHDGLELFFVRQAALREREKRYLRRILALYEKIAARRGETEEARAMAAQGRLRVARVLSVLGEMELAEEAFQTALPQYRKLAEDYPAVPLYRREWGICHLFLGEVFARRGQSRPAVAEFRAARGMPTEAAKRWAERAKYRPEPAPPPRPVR